MKRFTFKNVDHVSMPGVAVQHDLIPWMKTFNPSPHRLVEGVLLGSNGGYAPHYPGGDVVLEFPGNYGFLRALSRAEDPANPDRKIGYFLVLFPETLTVYEDLKQQIEAAITAYNNAAFDEAGATSELQALLPKLQQALELRQAQAQNHAALIQTVNTLLAAHGIE